MKTVENTNILLAAIVLLIIGVTAFLLFISEEKDIEIVEDENQSTVRVWDAEIADFREYASYGEVEAKRQLEIDEYHRFIEGTIVERVQNAEIPPYEKWQDDARLQDGEVRIGEDITVWSASLDKNKKSFFVGDFNNDGLDDVAHILGYTGGGSGYFYRLIIFLNENGELKYHAQKEIGDRIDIQKVDYNSGVFTLDIIAQGQGEDFLGFCCPNVPKTLKFKLEDGELIEL